MKRLQKLSLLGLLAFATWVPNGLEAQKCGSADEYQIEAWDRQFTNQMTGYSKTAGAVRTVPVVVTVIASSGTAASNISDAQIASQFPILNAAYRGNYGGVDTEIEFCHSGTIRVVDAILSHAQVHVNEAQVKALGGGDEFTHLNVWVVEELINQGGVPIGGYTQYPKFFNDFPELDGVLLPYYAWGNIETADDDPDFDEGKIAVHEIGHWLSLLHVFEGGCDNDWTCATTGDCCCDTPPQEAEWAKCNRRKNTCKTDNPDNDDPLNNYLGYTFDRCRTDFTACQSQRMNLCLDSVRQGNWFTFGDCPPPRLGIPMEERSRDFSIIAFPNPSKETVSIRLNVVGKETPFNMDIYDAHGKLVASLATSSVLAVGQHEYKFDAPAPGIYLARVASPWATKTIKLVSLAK